MKKDILIENKKGFFKKIKDKLSKKKDDTLIKLGDFIDGLEEISSKYEEINDSVIDDILEDMGYNLEKELNDNEDIKLAISLQKAIKKFKSVGINKMTPQDMEIFVNKL